MENILKNIEISVNSATCYKNNNIIFKNASIKISNGEVCIIMGPNGCGKTTFIKCLCKIHDLESGEILINNIDIQDEDSNFIDNILYIGHKNSLNDDLSVIENLEYFCAFDSTARFENFNKTKEAMKYFDIYKYKNYLISDLSEGNKKKISLARLIMSIKKYGC